MPYRDLGHGRHIRCDRYHLCRNRVAGMFTCEHIHKAVIASDQVETEQGKKYSNHQDCDFRFCFHFVSSFPIPTSIYVGRSKKDSSLYVIRLRTSIKY